MSAYSISDDKNVISKTPMPCLSNVPRNLHDDKQKLLTMTCLNKVVSELAIKISYFHSTTTTPSKSQDT